MSSVILTPVGRSDAAELIRANQESAHLHQPWVEPFTDLAGFEAYFESMASGEKVGLIAREKATGGVVGVLNLSQIFRKGFQNAYLGYYGMQGCGGRGFMTEAVRLTAAYAFNDLGLHRIEANVQPENARSIALLKRTGFRREGYSPRYLRIGGVWRDHERWSLLSDEIDI